MAGSVFAAPGDRKGPSAEPAIEAMKEDDCGRNGNKPCNELGDSPDLKSEKGSPKKKIVKKAGAAAAAGVAGKKITENIGDKITPGD